MSSSSKSKLPELLLKNVATMFVDEQFVVNKTIIGRKSSSNSSDSSTSSNSSTSSTSSRMDSSDSDVVETNFLRSKIKQSFRATFKRGSKLLTRSKSNESGLTNSEDEKRLQESRRAVSASPKKHSPRRVIEKPVPTPLVVEDPPSSENASDLDDVKYHNNPALLNGSSGNFGSAGARSAPSTPQGLLGSSPGGFSDPLSQPSSPGYITPSIQRSPSHNLFTKYDKGALKQLSCSTPAMTAQAQSPEPPSPKASSKDEKNTTSKARQKKFHRHFPVVDDDEKVLNHYSCALLGDILLQGQLYITNNYFAFYSNVFGYVTKLLIPLLSVQKITKEKTARIIPNAIGITTIEDKHVFGSLMSRDNTYRFMYNVWERARNSIPIEEPIPNIRTPSDMSDSSETRDESGKESTSELNARFTKCTPKPDLRKIGSDCVDKPLIDLTSKLCDDQRIPYLSKQKLLLFASTLLLVLLFLSAAVLLYRIGKIQHKYTLALQDNFAVSESEDVYSELLQWQTHLHSKSAGAVHSFLDTNLDQIAKVRQSLEALSTLLMPNESNVSHNAASTPSEIPNDS